MNFLGGVLYFIALVTILRVIFWKISSVTTLLIVSFVLGTLTEFLYLYAKGQFWAAGKALAYGYPFFLFLIAGFAFEKNFTFLPSALNQGLLFCISLWLILQISLGVARNVVAVTGIEYIDYASNHEDYRRYDYDISPLEAYLMSKPKSVIWTILPDIWTEEYINFALSGNQRLQDALAVTDHYNDLLGNQTLDTPQYILTDHNILGLNMGFVQYVVADNSSFVLLKIDRPDFLFLAISNPSGIEKSLAISTSYGVEKWDGKIGGFWVGKDKALITVVSSADAQVEFTANFIPGPSLPQKSSRDLRITLNNGSSSNIYTVVNEKKGFIFQVNRGENLISIEAIDQPTVAKLPNEGKHVLLIGLLDPTINFVGTNH